MARLIVPFHPGRVFKDDWWDNNSDNACGYLSIADHSGARPDAELSAFAVEFTHYDEGDENKLFNEIVNLSPPFIKAEIVRIDGGLFAIGFYNPE